MFTDLEPSRFSPAFLSSLADHARQALQQSSDIPQPEKELIDCLIVILTHLEYAASHGDQVTTAHNELLLDVVPDASWLISNLGTPFYGPTLIATSRQLLLVP